MPIVPVDVPSADKSPSQFVQPKPWIRWAALILAAAGWYVSMQSFRISAGTKVADPLMQAVCGGASRDGTDNCTAVLTAPQAYVPVSHQPGAPRIPISTFGMGYFALLGLWYLFIGPPTRSGRAWHVLIAAIVLLGVCYSLYYIGIMAYELHRWCGSCLAAHALNGGLALLTLLAWPWSKATKPSAPHPSTRLVLAATTSGGLIFVIHVTVVFVLMAGSVLNQRTAEYAKVLDDPAFIKWDFNNQSAVSIPLYDDEYFAGSPEAANTVMVFSDFQCAHCRRAHETLERVLEQYSDRLRIAYRHYPQDSECNSNERFRIGGHQAACCAARAAEAARIVGGPEVYARMRKLLYEHQDELSAKLYSRNTDQRHQMFAKWAAELDLDQTAFIEAMESPAVTARIQMDIQTAEDLDAIAIPVVYLNGRRLRNWSKLDMWAALLDSEHSPKTLPTSTPSEP